MKYVFLANPTVGHTNFMISLALQAKAAGNDVLFMLPGIKSDFLKSLLDNPSLNIDRKLREQSIPYKIISASLFQGILSTQIAGKRGLKEVLYALKVFSAGMRKYSNFLLKEFAQERPDVIVYDYTFFSAIAVAEKLNIRRVAIYHSGLPFFEYPIPPIGTSLRYGEFSTEEFEFHKKLIAKQEQVIRKRCQEIPNRHIGTDFLLSPNSPFLNIINSIKESEYPRNDLPHHVFFTGPSLRGHVTGNGSQISDRRHDRLIYISLGTVFNKQPNLFIKIIRSLELLNVDILVAAGASFNKLKKINFGTNVKIEKYVRQQEVLQHADIFITHGGKNSISESLMYGVPMILFPAGGEQEYNANLIEFLKAGRNFSAIKSDFTADDMKLAVDLLTSDNQIAQSVGRLKDGHANMDGANLAYHLIADKLKSNTNF